MDKREVASKICLSCWKRLCPAPGPSHMYVYSENAEVPFMDINVTSNQQDSTLRCNLERLEIIKFLCGLYAK